MHGRGHAWWAAYVVGHAWQGGMHFTGHVWQVGMHGRGACMARGRAWQGGVAWLGGMRGRRYGHCSGRYASYWNAFLLSIVKVFMNKIVNSVRVDGWTTELGITLYCSRTSFSPFYFLIISPTD